MVFKTTEKFEENHRSKRHIFEHGNKNVKKKNVLRLPPLPYLIINMNTIKLSVLSFLRIIEPIAIH